MIIHLLDFISINNLNLVGSSDNFCCLHFLYSKYLQNWRLPRFSMITNGIMGEKYLINIVEKENPAN
jgi:hypothetical protein